MRNYWVLKLNSKKKKVIKILNKVFETRTRGESKVLQENIVNIKFFQEVFGEQFEE